MFLVCHKKIGPLSHEFSVLGSTGNLYTVNICQLPKCNCPDNEKGNLCKHILFVYLKVLKVPCNSDVLPQKALLDSELESILRKRDDAPRAILANDKVRNAFDKIVQGDNAAIASTELDLNSPNRKPIEGDCPICFDELNSENPHEITYCKSGCGNNFHSVCWEHWCNAKRKAHAEVTCVYCRAVVTNIDEEKKNRLGIVNSEGYVNLGSLQNLPQTRDVSSYKAEIKRRRRMTRHYNDFYGFEDEDYDSCD